jgi:hypothetical protein
LEQTVPSLIQNASDGSVLQQWVVHDQPLLASYSLQNSSTVGGFFVTASVPLWLVAQIP